MDIESNINILHERTQALKLSTSTHEAVCEERYTQLLKTLEKMDSRLNDMQNEIKDLREMALTGKVSLRTLLWLGGAIGSTIALILTLAKYFRV